MAQYVEALGADREALLDICRQLEASTWDAPSGCVGWTVKDLVAHMGTLFRSVVDPNSLPDVAGMPTEAAQEVLVHSRRAMTVVEVVDDYATVSEQALMFLSQFTDSEMEIPLGDLGTYPARIVAAAFCFDHYTHIRADLFAPRGPLTGPPPPSDELRLGPTMDWINAALPQQNQAQLDGLGGPVEIVVTGTAARTIRLGDPNRPVCASVTSDADSCVRWVTQRTGWDHICLRTKGDQDSLAVLRALKVF